MQKAGGRGSQQWIVFLSKITKIIQKHKDVKRSNITNINQYYEGLILSTITDNYQQFVMNEHEVCLS